MAGTGSFLDEARRLIATGDHPAAVRVCRLGLLADPHAVAGRVLLARALLALGRHQEAALEAHAALRRAPRDADVLAVKARAHLAGGDRGRAAEAVASALALVPEHPEATALAAELGALGVALAQVAPPDEAAPQFVADLPTMAIPEPLAPPPRPPAPRTSPSRSSSERPSAPSHAAPEWPAPRSRSAAEPLAPPLAPPPRVAALPASILESEELPRVLGAMGAEADGERTHPEAGRRGRRTNSLAPTVRSAIAETRALVAEQDRDAIDSTHPDQDPPVITEELDARELVAVDDPRSAGAPEELEEGGVPAVVLEIDVSRAYDSDLHGPAADEPPSAAPRSSLLGAAADPAPDAAGLLSGAPPPLLPAGAVVAPAIVRPRPGATARPAARRASLLARVVRALRRLVGLG